MNKLQSISTLIFAVCLILVGVIQLLSSLYGSGLLIFLAGVIILIMRHELKECQNEK